MTDLYTERDAAGDRYYSSPTELADDELLTLAGFLVEHVMGFWDARRDSDDTADMVNALYDAVDTLGEWAQHLRDIREGVSDGDAFSNKCGDCGYVVGSCTCEREVANDG